MEDLKALKKPDFSLNLEEKEIWAEVETCKNTKNPLKGIYEKMEDIVDMENWPNELWLILPYRKLWIYGKDKIEKSLKRKLEKLFKARLEASETKARREPNIRLFLANLSEEQLEELFEGSNE